MIRNVVGVGGAIHCLWPDWAVGPVLDALDRTEDSGLDPLANLPGSSPRMTLVAHLRDDTALLRDGHQATALLESPSERLLAEDVLTSLHRVDRDHRVGVIRSRHKNCVDVLFGIKHLAVVGVSLRVGELADGSSGPLEVDVTEDGDVFVATAVDVRVALAAGADRRDVECVAGRRVAGTSEHVARNNGEASG